MATGLLSDWFPEEQRGLVMSIFNWGIYGGYGIAFPVGRYIPGLNIGNLVFSYIFFSNKEKKKKTLILLLNSFKILTCFVQRLISY